MFLRSPKYPMYAFSFMYRIQLITFLALYLLKFYSYLHHHIFIFIYFYVGVGVTKPDKYVDGLDSYNSWATLINRNWRAWWSPSTWLYVLAFHYKHESCIENELQKSVKSRLQDSFCIYIFKYSETLLFLSFSIYKKRMIRMQFKI